MIQERHHIRRMGRVLRQFPELACFNLSNWVPATPLANSWMPDVPTFIPKIACPAFARRSAAASLLADRLHLDRNTSTLPA